MAGRRARGQHQGMSPGEDQAERRERLQGWILLISFFVGGAILIAIASFL
jgi:hypothetical protein